MKQLLSLFLFLLPCLAWAQYPSNGNQKITLGEQTTADGLVYRGVAATDTVRKPSIDTMAYMVLDTTTNIIWHYKKATSNAWLRLNLLPSDTASMLTNYYRSGRALGTPSSGVLTNATGLPLTTGVTGTLGGANGGTGITSFGAAKYIPFASSATALTNDFGLKFDNPNKTLIVENALGGAATLNILGDNTGGSYIRMNRSLGSVVLASIGYQLTYGSGDVDGYSVYNAGGEERMRLNTAGELGIGYGATDNGAYRLQVKDSVYVGGNVSASAYTTRSDYNLKDDIFDLKYGLNDILQLQPVEYTYKSNGSKQLGFIAQDIGTILPEVVSFEESMSVNYQAIIPILTKAIQEQQAHIKALEQRIINLENK